MPTPSILPFVKMRFLNSCSQRASFIQWLHSGQQTVCPPNADSSPGNVLLNHSTLRQTSTHRKNCICKEDAAAWNKWYDVARSQCMQRYSSNHLINYTNKAPKHI